MNLNIEMKNIEVTFQTEKGNVKAVSDINITFENNTVTGLIGESGSGKSVLGMSILRLLPKTASVTGQCYFNGKDLINCDNKHIRNLRGKEISLIPQNPSESLNPVLKIKNQLVEAFTAHNKKFTSFMSQALFLRKNSEQPLLKRKELALQKSRELLKRFGFENYEEIMKKYTFQMSGGMNQRIISVLGLMCSPKWIIADEPTKGLDAILRRQVYNVLKDILEEHKVSMILITHDIMLAQKLCDKIIVMYSGQIVEQGNAKDVINNPKHPYTKGLINSLPDKGMVPISLKIKDRKENNVGCKFYSRCEYSKERCAIESPKDYRYKDERIVRCFLYDRS